VILVTIVIGTMLVLSWQITLVRIAVAAGVLIPARRVDENSARCSSGVWN